MMRDQQLNKLKIVGADHAANGGNDAGMDSSARKRRLRRIEVAARMAEKSHYGPAASRFTLTTIAVLVVLYGIYSLSQGRAWGRFFPDYYGMLAPAVAVIAGVIAYKTGPFKTWPELIYSLLASYDPLDTGAYRALQDAVRERGYDGRAVRDFLGSEWVAIRGPVTAAALGKASAKADFLHKSI